MHFTIVAILLDGNIQHYGQATYKPQPVGGACCGAECIPVLAKHCPDDQPDEVHVNNCSDGGLRLEGQGLWGRRLRGRGAVC